MVHLVIEFVTIVTTYSNTLGPHAPYLLSTVVVQQKIITSFITIIYISTHSISKLININLSTTCTVAVGVHVIKQFKPVILLSFNRRRHPSISPIFLIRFSPSVVWFVF